MAVRSKQLAAVELSNATVTTLYTVPTGFRTIVKGISIRNTTSSATSVTLQVWASGSRVSYMTFNLGTFGSTTDAINAEVWQVLEEGQSLRAGCGSGGGVIIVSGAELEL